MEEIWEIDQIVSTFGVGICDDFVVGEVEAEDVAVDYDDCFWGGSIAYYVCI